MARSSRHLPVSPPSSPLARAAPLLTPLPYALTALLLLPSSVLASSGDRNPTFQHCLRGCQLTYCDPSQPPIALYLRAFGWTCEDNCKYECGHSFTDNIKSGSRWHQFYGKWPFYRFGPLQEPVSILMSLGNLWVARHGLAELQRRVRPENGLRRWLQVLAYVQMNTWIWSTVFHSRDTPWTERLDYFSATITIAYSSLYTILRVSGLVTPLSTHRLALPVAASTAALVLAHFTYLLSFPTGSFPYGYHTKFALCLSLPHTLLWLAWTASFFVRLPSLSLSRFTIGLPYPYPPKDPLTQNPRHRNAAIPALLVAGTLLAMSFELLDFPPIGRLVDAHSVWHAATIPLGMAWWSFLCDDAIELEGALLRSKGVSHVPADAKMPLSGPTTTTSSASASASASTSTGKSSDRGLGFGQDLNTPGSVIDLASPGRTSPDGPSPMTLGSTPKTPLFAQVAASNPPPRSRSPGRSPGAKGDRED